MKIIDNEDLLIEVVDVFEDSIQVEIEADFFHHYEFLTPSHAREVALHLNMLADKIEAAARSLSEAEGPTTTPKQEEA